MGNYITTTHKLRLNFAQNKYRLRAAGERCLAAFYEVGVALDEIERFHDPTGPGGPH